MCSIIQCERVSLRSGKTMNSLGHWYTIWVKNSEIGLSIEGAGAKPPRYSRIVITAILEPVEGVEA